MKYKLTNKKNRNIMKKKIKISNKMKITSLLSGLFFVGCHFTQQVLPSDAGSSCASGPQALTPAEFNSWFASGSVSLNGLVNPANSVTFPNIPNCSFYKWSEQMFLWLTSPAPASYGGGGGLVMNSPIFYDVSLPNASGEREFLPHTVGKIRAFNLRTAQKGALDLPIVIEKKSLRMLEVLPPVLSASGKQLILDAEGNELEIGSVKLADNNRAVFTDISGREIKGPRALIQSKKDTSANALTFMKKLRKLENFDRSGLVQKIKVDKKTLFLDLGGNFHETEQGQADGGVLMAQNGSLVYYSLSVNNVFALYRTMQGATVPAGTSFPTTAADLASINAFAVANGKAPVIDDIALAIEIKASWVEAAGLPDAEKFIKMKAIVPEYDKTNPDDWVPNGTKTVELALVGLHVVGSAAGHPELIWGTFEHQSNDPAADYTYKNTSNVNTNVPQNTTGNWVFCANGATGPFNQMRMMMGGADGKHIVSTPGFSIGPSNILKTMPWGLPGTNANGNAEVISTTTKVRSMLDPADLRGKYFQTGTTWTIGGAAPNAGNQVGTNKLANSTMETFAIGSNCFSCHLSNKTTVSHIFDDTKPLF
jgi:hypothetical protein